LGKASYVAQKAGEFIKNHPGLICVTALAIIAMLVYIPISNRSYQRYRKDVEAGVPEKEAGIRGRNKTYGDILPQYREKYEIDTAEYNKHKREDSVYRATHNGRPMP
jgi:hypothetical protein